MLEFHNEALEILHQLHRLTYQKKNTVSFYHVSFYTLVSGLQRNEIETLKQAFSRLPLP